MTQISRISVATPLLVLLLFSWPGISEAQTEPAAVALQHERLETALEQYLQIAESGGWPAVPAGPTIRPGARDPRNAVLARLLIASGDLDPDGKEFVEYDDELQAAVLRFQSRHGLEPDALVGRATLRAMNVSAKQRVNQIRLTLDRLRQVLEKRRMDFVLINIPAFEMHLIRAGETVWSSKVVVGETEAETPLFEATMRSVVLNPTWTVPHSIASEELLPKIQNDLDFLSRGGYELRDREGSSVDLTNVDWSSLNKNNFPYTLVQQSGPGNELGRVKFLFPNQYGVCMHDTPSKYLFEKYSRAFSHGCIRLDQPIDFAAELLNEEGWSREQIDAQLESTETRSVALTEPLPVVITYLTTAVDEAGTVYFYHDIYGKDAGAH